MNSDIKTVSIPVDDQFELVVELPEILTTTSGCEGRTCSGDLYVKGPVGKPPPDTVVGKVVVSTTVSGADEVERLLQFECVFKLSERGVPAA